MTYLLIPAETTPSPAIPVQRPVLLIGRHPECDFRIDLAKISRRHCCVALAYDRVFVRDLGSHNGVRVNGRVVEEAMIKAGDEVAIGPLIYRLVAESSSPAQADGGTPRPTESSKGPEPGKAGMPRPSVAPNRGDDIDLVPLDDS